MRRMDIVFGHKQPNDNQPDSFSQEKSFPDFRKFLHILPGLIRLCHDMIDLSLWSISKFQKFNSFTVASNVKVMVHIDRIKECCDEALTTYYQTF